jgi:hypothetical protein
MFRHTDVASSHAGHSKVEDKVDQAGQDETEVVRERRKDRCDHDDRHSDLLREVSAREEFWMAASAAGPETTGEV